MIDEELDVPSNGEATPATDQSEASDTPAEDTTEDASQEA